MLPRHKAIPMYKRIGYTGHCTDMEVEIPNCGCRNSHLPVEECSRYFHTSGNEENSKKQGYEKKSEKANTQESSLV